MTVLWMALGALSALCAIRVGRPGEALRGERELDEAAPSASAFALTVSSLTVAGTDGRTVDVLAGSRPRFVIVDFWATWCTPCLGEIAELNLLTEELSSEASMVGVLIEGFETGQADPLVLEKLAELDLRYPVYFATTETYKAFEALIHRPVAAVPTKLVIDREGRRVYLIEGVQPVSLYRRLVRRAAKEGT